MPERFLFSGFLPLHIGGLSPSSHRGISPSPVGILWFYPEAFLMLVKFLQQEIHQVNLTLCHKKLYQPRTALIACFSSSCSCSLHRAS